MKLAVDLDSKTKFEVCYVKTIEVRSSFAAHLATTRQFSSKFTAWLIFLDKKGNAP
jgi:hypothetical protein